MQFLGKSRYLPQLIFEEFFPNGVWLKNIKTKFQKPSVFLDFLMEYTV